MRLRLSVVSTLLLAAAAGPAAAQTGTFTFNATTGSGAALAWNVPTNWTPTPPATGFPNAVDAVAIFPPGTGDRTIPLNQTTATTLGITVGQLIIQAPTGDFDVTFQAYPAASANRTMTFQSTSGPAVFTLEAPADPTWGGGSFVSTTSNRVIVSMQSDLVVNQNQNLDNINGFTFNAGMTGGNFLLTKNGDGNLSIQTANPGHSGPTVVNAGAVRITSNRMTASTGVTVNNGGQFQIDDNAVGAFFNLAAGATLTLNGAGKTAGVSPEGAFRYQNGGGFSASLSNSGGTILVPVNLASTSSVFIAGNAPAVFSTVTFPGIVSGPGELVKIGPGALVLGNAANDFTGAVTVADGYLSVGSVSDGGVASHLGAGAGPITLGGATTFGVLNYAGATGSSTNRPLVVNAGGGGVNVANAAATVTLTTSPTVTGPLTLGGPGNVALGGAAAYTGPGPLRLRAGGVTLDNTAAVADRFADALGLTADGGRLTLIGNAAAPVAEAIGTVTLTGGLTATAAAAGQATDLTLAGISRSPGSTVDFVGTGGTLGTAGGPRVFVTAYNAAPPLTNGVLADSAGGVPGFATVNGTDFATYAAANGVTAVATTAFPAASAPTANAQLTGSGNTGASAGTFALNTLKVTPTAAGEALDINGTGNLEAGGIVVGTANAYTISSTGGGALNVPAVTYLHTGTGQVLTVSAPLTGAGLLTKGGDGTLVLTGATTGFTGTASLAAGTLRGDLPAAVLTTTPSGTYDLGGVARAVGALAGTGTVSLGAGTLTVNGLGGEQTFAGTITGAGGLTKEGPGTQVLAGGGLSNYTGVTTVNAGTLAMTANGVLGAAAAASNTVVAATGTLELRGGVDYTLAEPVNLGGTISNQIGNNTFRGAVTLAAGGVGTFDVAAGTSLRLTASIPNTTGGLTKVGTGTLIFGNNMGTSYTGPTNVNAGTLLVEGTGGSFLSSLSLVTIAPGAVFDFNNNPEDYGSVQGAGELRLGNLPSGFSRSGQDNLSVTFSGVISGAGAVFKAGTGVWTLSGTNTYTGNTTVEAGTLALANNGTTTTGSIATSPNVIVGTTAGSTTVFDVTGVTNSPQGFALAAGQTLGGHGTVAGNVTVGGTATVSPGTSVGIITQGPGSTMFWEPGGGLLLEYSSLTSPVAGTHYDLVTGPAAMLDLSDLTAGSPFNLALAPIGSPTDPGTPVSMTFATFGSIVGPPVGDVTNLFNITGIFPGTASVSNSGTALTLTLTPVPEPGTLALTCAVAIGGAWWRRRRG